MHARLVRIVTRLSQEVHGLEPTDCRLWGHARTMRWVSDRSDERAFRRWCGITLWCMLSTRSVGAWLMSSMATASIGSSLLRRG